jgi:hypothetical protein
MSGDDLIDIVKLLAACLDSQYKSDQKVAKDAIIEILEDKPIIVRDLDGNVTHSAEEHNYDDGKPLTNLQRIHELEEMVSKLEEKNAKMRDQLRWRKWPEESPSESGCYAVRLPGKCFTMTGYWNCFGDWDLKYERFYWMPQIPLPKESE